MIESEISAALRPYLLPGERIVWTGRPAAGVRFSAYDIFLVPFSLVWTGIVSVVAGGSLLAALRGHLVALPVLLAPGFMFLVGLYLVFGRFLVDAWVRQGTIYALTERRALLLRQAFGEKLLTHRLDGAVRVSRQRGERGTLEFGASNPFRAFQGAGLWTPSLMGDVAFVGVADVMRVYALANPRSVTEG
jgi:hypothetical protein